MTIQKWLPAAFGVILVGLSAPAPTRALARSNELDRMTCVTFTRPVALPGVALRSGTYIFELADPIGAWDLVRVSSHDRRVVFLTTFTRVVDRPSGMSPEQAFSFGEATGRSPQPIKTWWIAGEPTGRQFIYE